MCQDALNGPSRLRETRRTSPLAHPTTSRPKPKAWVGRVAHGAPPPYMGPYGPRIYHRTTLTRNQSVYATANHAGFTLVGAASTMNEHGTT